MRTISAVWSSWGPSPQLRTFSHALHIQSIAILASPKCATCFSSASLTFKQLCRPLWPGVLEAVHPVLVLLLNLHLALPSINLLYLRLKDIGLSNFTPFPRAHWVPPRPRHFWSVQWFNHIMLPGNTEPPQRVLHCPLFLLSLHRICESQAALQLRRGLIYCNGLCFSFRNRALCAFLTIARRWKGERTRNSDCRRSSKDGGSSSLWFL